MKKLFALVAVAALTLTACGTAEEAVVVEDTMEDLTIQVYTRDTSSGTRDGFMTKIDFGDAKADDSVLVEGFKIAGNSEIIDAVRKDEAAIGYISLSSLVDDVKGLYFNGVEPTEENVNNGTYLLSRNFNYMLRDEYADDTIRQISEAFVAYVGTLDGKADILGAGGIVDLSTGETWETVSADHPVCALDNSGLTVKFGGSDSVEKVATALSPNFAAVCGNFVPEHNHTGSSNAFKGLNGDNNSADDALYIHIGFASREFKDSEPANTTGKLATDAIVAVVNPNNAYSDTSAEDLKAIYSGEVTTWGQLAK
jgi:phosphate transport system substrate-binding protein